MLLDVKTGLYDTVKKKGPAGLLMNRNHVNQCIKESAKEIQPRLLYDGVEYLVISFDFYIL